MNESELKKEIEPWLQNVFEAKTEVENITPLVGGACQENSLLDIHIQSGERAGRKKIVLRSDRGSSLFSSLNRAQEFTVAKAAFDAGCLTPEPYQYEMDDTILGRPFSIMQWIPGKATGRFIVKDPSIAKYRPQMATDLAKNLAAIHSVIPKKEPGAGLAFLEKAEHPAKGAVDAMRGEMQSLQEPHLAMELAINWLEKNTPETDQHVLVHGDFRTGNFMVTPEGLQGILDWEFAHFGDRHEDISWLCMRDWRFGKLNKEVGGFSDREPFYEAYEKHSGISVDPKKVLYWEVMGNLRWAVGAAAQAERHLSGKTKGIELASIGRRVAEMEYEMLRLIESA